MTAPPVEPPAAPQRSDEGRATADVRTAVIIVAALGLVGLLLGLLWTALSPGGGLGLVRAPGAIQADETENWVKADGWFVVLTGATGLLAGVVAWTRVKHRGPLMITALAVGGLLGAVLTEITGYIAGGGTTDGAPNTVIRELPLSLHMSGMRFLEAALAVIVYGVFAAFAAADDLGRPDPVRDSLLQVQNDPAPYPPPYQQQYPQQYPQQYGPPSVGPAAHPEYGGGDGDGPGVLQKRDLPPQ